MGGKTRARVRSIPIRQSLSSKSFKYGWERPITRAGPIRAVFLTVLTEKEEVYLTDRGLSVRGVAAIDPSFMVEVGAETRGSQNGLRIIGALHT